MLRQGTRELLSVLPFAAALAVGCTSSSSEDPRDAGTRTEEQCDRLGADVYVAGIEHVSADGRLRVKILDAIPAPPASGENTWSVQLLDGSGAPMGNVAPRLRVTNPARRLEPPRAPVVSPVDPAKGIFRVEQIVFGIPGIWQIEVGTDADAGAQSFAAFHFCVST